MNELKVISLNDCPYSMAAEDLINNIKKSDKVNVIIINVSFEDKEKYKQGDMKTFPQIYFNNEIIGGYEDFKEIYNFIQNKNSGNRNLDDIISMLKALRLRFSKFIKVFYMKILNLRYKKNLPTFKKIGFKYIKIIKLISKNSLLSIWSNRNYCNWDF